jgi:hypothetical protein
VGKEATGWLGKQKMKFFFGEVVSKAERFSNRMAKEEKHWKFLMVKL